MKFCLELEQPGALSFQHFRHRNTRPLGNNLRDFVLGDPISQQRHIRCVSLLRLLQLSFQLRNSSVLQFRHACQVTTAPGSLQLELYLFQVFFDLLRPMQGKFLCVPDAIQVSELLLQFGDLNIEILEPLPGTIVFFVLQRFSFNFQLDQAPFQPIHLLGFGIHFHTNQARGLIDEVNSFIRQMPVGDIAITQLCRSNDGRVCNIHTVMQLITVFEPP